MKEKTIKNTRLIECGGREFAPNGFYPCYIKLQGKRHAIQCNEIQYQEALKLLGTFVDVVYCFHTSLLKDNYLVSIKAAEQ